MKTFAILLPKETQNTNSKKDMHPLFTAALLQQPRYGGTSVSRSEWIMKTWYIYTREHDSAIGKKEVLHLPQHQ